MPLLNWKHEDMRNAGFVYRFLHPVVPSWHNRLCRLRVKGVENVPATGGAILAINHLSWWDPLLVAATLERPVHFIAKREVIVGPLTDRFFRSSGVIPVDRSAKGQAEVITKSVECLEGGGILGIFPEGTRGTIEEPREPRSGMARLALLTGAPVIPVAVLSDRFWPVGRKAPKFGEPNYVNFGEPVWYGKDSDLAQDKDATRRIARELFDRILARRDEAYAARERGDPWPRVQPIGYHPPGRGLMRKLRRKDREDEEAELEAGAEPGSDAKSAPFAERGAEPESPRAAGPDATSKDRGAKPRKPRRKRGGEGNA